LAQANPAGANVHVEAENADGVTTIRVSDDGPGIPPSILESIFEPDVTTKKSRGRRGMGMHIVHTMVTECGGTVTAANGDETGAVFTIQLPAGRFE
jgi:C4-dicarboxylate-specific signal transduction histidine kinase